jgi:hypothetical protein
MENKKYIGPRIKLRTDNDTIWETTPISESITLDTSLTYSKTPEEEYEEQRNVALAESYLNSLGIKVKTDMYGFYRNTYDILLDLGKYLSKNNNL